MLTDELNLTAVCSWSMWFLTSTTIYSIFTVYIHSPMVLSQNFSAATSLAMLAPIRTLTSMPIFSRMMSEMSFNPSGPSSMPYKEGKKREFYQHQRSFNVASHHFLLSRYNSETQMLGGLSLPNDSKNEEEHQSRTKIIREVE